MPLGNGSCSWLIIWRFIGMARNTPRAAVKKTMPVITHHGRWWPSTSIRAANALPTVPPVEYPAADAVLCMQLFSSRLIWLNRPALNARSRFQSTNDITQAVMATPKAQPILSVVYRLEIDRNIPSKPPVSTARHVSCFWSSPW